MILTWLLDNTALEWPPSLPAGPLVPCPSRFGFHHACDSKLWNKSISSPIITRKYITSGRVHMRECGWDYLGTRIRTSTRRNTNYRNDKRVSRSTLSRWRSIGHNGHFLAKTCHTPAPGMKSVSQGNSSGMPGVVGATTPWSDYSLSPNFCRGSSACHNKRKKKRE